MVAIQRQSCWNHYVYFLLQRNDRRATLLELYNNQYCSGHRNNATETAEMSKNVTVSANVIIAPNPTYEFETNSAHTYLL